MKEEKEDKAWYEYTEQTFRFILAISAREESETRLSFLNLYSAEVFPGLSPLYRF